MNRSAAPLIAGLFRQQGDEPSDRLGDLLRPGCPPPHGGAVYADLFGQQGFPFPAVGLRENGGADLVELGGGQSILQFLPLRMSLMDCLVIPNFWPNSVFVNFDARIALT